MALSHSRYTDASGSTFNDVGRDQIINNYNVRVIQINISLFGSRRTLPSLRRDNDHRPNAIIPYRRSEAVFIVDASVALIVQIAKLLIDRRESLNTYLDLKLELQSLCQSLILTKATIEAYDNRPLGQNLANTITPEVERCHVVLQELHDRANGTWQGLNFTNISELWRPVWWSRWDSDELASVKRRLSESQKSLAGFLIALNLVAWMEFGNEVSTSHVSLRKFHTSLKQHLPSLRHIQLDTVQVVDHLGRSILVPTIFCSTWKDFDYIINGYCRDRVGNQFIERGDYEVIRAQDNHIIGPSEFASVVESGMVLEMSIVLRRKMAYQEKCPRCRHMNLNGAINSGWIECYNCSA